MFNIVVRIATASLSGVIVPWNHEDCMDLFMGITLKMVVRPSCNNTVYFLTVTVPFRNPSLATLYRHVCVQYSQVATFHYFCTLHTVDRQIYSSCMRIQQRILLRSLHSCPLHMLHSPFKKCHCHGWTQQQLSWQSQCHLHSVTCVNTSLIFLESS